MPKQNVHFQSFAVGIVDPDKLPRIDLERMRLAAEIQTNFIPTTSGKAFHRPGLGYLGQTLSNLPTVIRPFVAGSDSAALLELVNGGMRVRINDVLVTRPAVSCTIPDSSFDLGGFWTLAPTAGATATVGLGSLRLTAAAKGSLALAKQQISTGSAGVEHGLRVVIDRGPVTFRVGTAEGADDLIEETQLRSGSHSLGFTPPGASFWIQFQSDAPVLRNVADCFIEAAGAMVVPTPWTDPSTVRFAQSADVVFAAAPGIQQYRIERRSDRAWSVGRYESDDGPFGPGRTAPVKLKSNVTQGNGQLTSDKPFFRAGHLGALFRLHHTGQRILQTLAAESTFTDPIEVTGVNTSISNDRDWAVAISGTWAGTLKTFRSFDGPDFGYQPYRREDGSATVDITANAVYANEDEDDNAIIYYRYGFDTGLYTSGTVGIDVDYDGGGGYGVVRVVQVNSTTSVDIDVLKPLKSLKPTDDWQESEWSGVAGWPSGTAFFEGRLWWGGRDRFWGSVSDAYESFDDNVEGDSGPILRSIATGGVNQIQWVAPLQRLVMGTDVTETSARSSSFDEPMTPSNVVLKSFSTIGSAAVDPAKIDQRGIFVDRSRTALFEMVFSGEKADYQSAELTRLASKVFSVGIRELAVQRRPDTRIWCVLDNGKVGLILYEPSQEVVASTTVETDGLFRSVAVLPAVGQDCMYFVVQRSINSNTVYSVEKMALDSEAIPGGSCKTMDSFVTGTNGPASTTISGLGHLVGKSVVVRGGGLPLSGTFEVSGGGTITLPNPVGNYIVGLPYRSRYKSARLAYAAAGGTALLQKQKVDSIGLMLTDFERAGVKFGPEFDNPDRPLDPLPPQINGETAPARTVGIVTDEDMTPFGGPWTVDARICLEVNSPYGASLVGMVFGISTNA